MTGYTKLRKYPYPSSSREAGNGGLHSEQLARAVAADLDTLDAGWAAELQHATLLMTKSGDSGGISSGGISTMTTLTTEKQTTNPGLTPGSGLRAVVGGYGWYHIVFTLRSKASGAITVGAHHRAYISEYVVNESNNLTLVRDRVTVSYQSGSLDVFNQIETILYIGPGTEIRFRFYHTNTGSQAIIVGSGTGGTRIAATRIAGG